MFRRVTPTSCPLPHGSGLALGERPLVMGILNVTPDSFADAERLDTARAVDAALAMEAAGADIIDIGGESTRPGAAPVAADEELRRVVPVLRALAGRLHDSHLHRHLQGRVASAAIG